MRFRHLAAFALILAASGEAFAQTNRDLSIEQNTAAQAGKPQPGTLRVTGSVDRQDLIYAVGETVRIFVQSNEDAYITIVNVGPSGQVTQLFPNAYQTNNHIKANQRIEIPAPNSGSRITVTGPFGAELIKVFASSEPVKVIPESQLQGKGAFRSMPGGVEALVRNLEVVGSAPAPARKFAIHNLIIKTVASRAAAPAPDQSFIVVPGQPAPQAAPAAPPAGASSAAPASAPANAPVSAPANTASSEPPAPATGQSNTANTAAPAAGTVQAAEAAPTATTSPAPTATPELQVPPTAATAQ